MNGKEKISCIGRAVFSDEKLAIERLDSIGTSWKSRTLTQIYEKNEHISGPTVRIYTNCVFDLFHYGHANFFCQIKKLIPNSYLIVGVCSDEDTLKYKKVETVMKASERADLLTHCRYVDEVNKKPLYIPTKQYLDSLKVDLIAYNTQFLVESPIGDIYSPFKDLDRFLGIQRTSSILTTSIIQRILDNLELYQQRQKSRLLEKYEQPQNE